jgi:transposase
VPELIAECPSDGVRRLGVVMMPGDDVLTEPAARRIEVFTGAGRRRRWSSEAKARIVAESYSTSVGEAADRYGLAKTQLFTWRREARGAAVAPAASLFAPVVVEAAPEPPARSRPPRRKGRHGRDGRIELEIDGVTIRVERGAEAKTISAIIRALKAGR